MTDSEKRLKYLEITKTLEHLDYLFKYLDNYDLKSKHEDKLLVSAGSKVIKRMKKDVYSRLVSLLYENLDLISTDGGWEP